MIRLIRNARIVDGVSPEPRDGHALLIEDDRILALDRESELQHAPAYQQADEVIDAAGKTLVPGLINAHEHITWRRSYGSWTDRVVAKRPSWLLARGAGHCLLSLREGVTTIRDVGAKDDTAVALRDAIDDGLILGPRMKVCRQTIAMTGGHAYETSVVANGPDEVRRAAREQLLQGADFIKLMASGGAVAKNRDFPWSPQFTLEEMRAAFEEAHHADRLTTVHCHPPQQIRTAVEAGVDCIEHGALIDPATAAFLAERQIPLVPTLAAKESFLVHGEAYGRDPASIEQIRAKRPETIRNWCRIRETGVRLVAGVDSLGDLNLELSLFVEIGMSPYQALLAATRHAAETIGMGEEVGTVEVGKYADLLLVNRDPIEDIDHLKDLAWVMKGGARYTPAELDKAMGPRLTQPR